jgi:nucleolar MIF4G domain-containing protein 1
VSRNRGPLQEIVLKATKINTLAMGLAYFLSEPFNELPDSSGLVGWGVEVAKEALRTSVGNVL